MYKQFNTSMYSKRY